MSRQDHHRAAVRIAQEVLAKAAGYRGAIDGLVGNQSLAAALRVPDPHHPRRALPPIRRVIAGAQLALANAGHNPGPIDGFMGQQTEAAAAAYLGPAWARADDLPGPRSIAHPYGTERSVVQRFGLPGNRHCTAGRVEVPWPMFAAWDTTARIPEIRCHAALAPSLRRILEQVADEHNPSEIRNLGLHLYGGCFNKRRKRGGGAWSMHAFGIALDWDPLRNRLRWDGGRARLAKPDAARFWAAWEKEGWTSLGRARNFDWMHVQAVGL